MVYLVAVSSQWMSIIPSTPPPSTSQLNDFVERKICLFYASCFLHRAMNVSMVYGGPTHIKLVCEWEPQTKAEVFGVIPDQLHETHESVEELRQYYDQPLQTSLTDSLNIYTREETVSMCCA